MWITGFEMQKSLYRPKFLIPGQLGFGGGLVSG